MTRTAPPGERLARRQAREDTTPGKVLALALLANAPIFLGFVLVLLFTQGDTMAARRFVPLITWTTPLFAVLSVGVYLRAPGDRKAHRASRIGLTLAIVALLLWALVVYSSVRAPAP